MRRRRVWERRLGEAETAARFMFDTYGLRPPGMTKHDPFWCECVLQKYRALLAPKLPNAKVVER